MLSSTSSSTGNDSKALSPTSVIGNLGRIIDTPAHKPHDACIEQLRALALEEGVTDATQLERVNRIGHGAFATVELYSRHVGVTRRSRAPSVSSGQPDTASLPTSPRARSWASRMHIKVPVLSARRSSDPTQGVMALPENVMAVKRMGAAAAHITTPSPFSRDGSPKIVRSPTPGVAASTEKLFLIESVLHRVLVHDNIVRHRGMVEFAPSREGALPELAIAMEYMGGGTLKARIDSKKHSPAQGVQWLIGAARGLAHMHAHGVAHRDFKPENVLLTTDMQVAKVADFGLSRPLLNQDLMADGAAPRKMVIGGGDLTGEVGTARYMAPEMIHGDDYSVAVDVYSFGIVSWEVLSSKTAYKDTYFTGEIIMKAVAEGKLRPPIPPAWPPRVADLLRRCWTTKAADRPTMAQVVDALGILLVDAEKDPGTWRGLPRAPNSSSSFNLSSRPALSFRRGTA
mmetsp:Transcript_6954/g.18911  ORF Transcript_6954/g.18911 Transcript_6954/m.18911 type:complete len:457 (-) Transcript_6954:502-1872(-)